MDSPPGTTATTLGLTPEARATGGRRAVRHALALVLAATIAWLVFAAYRQPELMLDLAVMRIC